VIEKIVINTIDQNRILISPTGEKIELQRSKTIDLDHIVINTSSILKTTNDLKSHGFSKIGSFYTNGKVKFILKLIENTPVVNGSINHIAFDVLDIQKKYSEIIKSNIPIIEGINTLPFFQNGVKYFVTENFEGLVLEYNQRIRSGV
jgi:hypothetical protein